MSGSSDDISRAESFRKGDEQLLWFRRGGREYIVRDPALLQTLKKFTGRFSEIGGDQAKIGSKQAEIGGRQAEIGKQTGVQLGGSKPSSVPSRHNRSQASGVCGSRHAGNEKAEKDELESERRELEQEMQQLDSEMQELSAQMDTFNSPMDELSKEMNGSEPGNERPEPQNARSLRKGRGRDVRPS